MQSPTHDTTVRKATIIIVAYAATTATIRINKAQIESISWSGTYYFIKGPGKRIFEQFPLN